MEKQKFILHIESYSSKDGMLLLSAKDYGIRAALRDFCKFLHDKHNSYVKVELSAPYPGRTLPQNAKWWAMCTEYGRHCGMSKDEVAIGVKYRAMDEGLWDAEEIPFSKTGRKQPVSTTKSDTSQMAVLIDVLYRIAAEDGYTFEN